MAGKRALAAVTIAAFWSFLPVHTALGSISDSEELTRIPPPGVDPGSGAGELRWSPVSLNPASDPVTGHIFVPDADNNRISEFTPWGDFVKAFGYDVAEGAVNEQQEVRVRATSGQFTLTFLGSSTADLPFNATAAAVEAALRSLPSIGAEGVSVKSVPGSGSITPHVHVITFKGPLAAMNVEQLQAADGTTPLEGDGELIVRTRADGTAGGVGLESCTGESGCKEGIVTSELEQVSNGPTALAVGASGDIYVKEHSNFRVQTFDSAGRFLWMVGGKVNQTTDGNLCTAGEACRPGVVGGGEGEFGANFGGITFCPPTAPLCGGTGAIYVGDEERIQRFAVDGTYESPELAVPGETVEGLAFDPVDDDFYVTYSGKSGVHELDGETGAELSEEREGERALATNSEGELFAHFDNRVLQYNAVGDPLVPPSCCESTQSVSGEDEPRLILGLGINGAGNLHVAYAGSFIRVFGPGPAQFEGPPPAPPQISAQFASSVQRDGATVAAMINPRFFTDTTYRVQYGTSECSSGGCTESAPQELTKKVFGSPVRSPGVFLEGLTPGTTYYYRFVAQSSGGGPTVGAEATFTTPDLLTKPPCPNEVFRGGPSARLPDCRAYEMVSPVDKNNGDIKTLLDFVGFETKLGRATPDGEGLTYSSSRSFGAPKGAPLTNQYLARRIWASEAISPAQGPGADANAHPNAIGNPYKLFSEDLCTGWFVVSVEPLLNPPRDFRSYQNVYRRDFCGGAPDEALLPLQPTVVPEEFTPEPQGTSADGKAAIVRVEGLPLAASNRWQTYYTRDGEITPLCVLPGGVQASGNCSGGTGIEDPDTLQIVDLYRQSNVAGAISRDGNRVYWTDTATEKESGTGTLYLRINPGAEEESASGCEEGKACTVPVLGTVTSNPAARARFLQANPEGTRALFEVTAGGFKETLYLYDSESGSSRSIAGGLVGLAAAGKDLSRVYFVSRNVLSGTAGAIAGQPNLYLDEEGTKTFIATLSEEDVSPANVSDKGFPSNTALGAIYHAARATADGGELAFISNRSLTGYDNTDLLTGQPNSEVYLYEAGAEDPVCVSCNPSGQRPRGERVTGNGPITGSLAVAGMLPLPNDMFYTPRALSEDGERLFFESFDSLLPRDVNGAKDVYEWESAASKAECAQRGADLYVSDSGGCLSLISSGESPEDSEFVDASASGNDVFFITNSGLLPQDPGLFDVYDARVNGGLPLPPPPVECQGETCKPPITAPNDPTPASSSYSGPGDLEEKAKKKKKKKAKKKKKKGAKKGKGKKKAAKNGRAGR